MKVKIMMIMVTFIVDTLTRLLIVIQFDMLD